MNCIFAILQYFFLNNRILKEFLFSVYHPGGRKKQFLLNFECFLSLPHYRQVSRRISGLEKSRKPLTHIIKKWLCFYLDICEKHHTPKFPSTFVYLEAVNAAANATGTNWGQARQTTRKKRQLPKITHRHPLSSGHWLGWVVGGRIGCADLGKEL
jgi:hypothetical protein